MSLSDCCSFKNVADLGGGLAMRVSSSDHGCNVLVVLNVTARVRVPYTRGNMLR